MAKKSRKKAPRSGGAGTPEKHGAATVVGETPPARKQGDLPEGEGRPISPIWLLLALAAAGLAISVYAWNSKPLRQYYVDDAAIGFTFSRNIAEGYGSVAYPGGERVEGFSNPLWTALLAGCCRLGGDPFAWSQRLALLFGSVALLLLAFFGLTADAGKRRPWPVVLALGLVATHGAYVIWNHSGLENSLYALLLAAAILLVVREARRESGFPWSAVVLALLAVTRPEAPAHAALAGAFLFVSDLTRHRRLLPRFFVWVATFVGLFGLYQLWHYFYFAHPLANTAYAKVEPALKERLFSRDSRGWVYLRGYFEAYKLLPLLFWTIPAFLSLRTIREALYLALTAGFIAFFPLVSNGDWMEAWRFLSWFPIPLALLLGLAAHNLALDLVWVAEKVRLERQMGLILGTLLAVAWVAIPTTQVYRPSEKQLQRFVDEKEVRYEGIARRAFWWEKIAQRLGHRPQDLLMCDMDMGGTSYNWPGRILDIGYLLDVAMATHRQGDEEEWRTFMEEYFFEETPPDFIHIREGWGARTTIPRHPRFAREYLRLPEDDKFSKLYRGKSKQFRPNGNYVRRELFELRQPPAPLTTPPSFTAGLTLYSAEIPAALYPGERTPFFFTWKRETDKTPPVRFAVAFVEPGQQPDFQVYSPLMDWLPTDAWPRDRYLRETVSPVAPGREGEYGVAVAVLQPFSGQIWPRLKINEDKRLRISAVSFMGLPLPFWSNIHGVALLQFTEKKKSLGVFPALVQVRRLPAQVRVGRQAAADLAVDLLRRAEKAAARDAKGAKAAAELLRAVERLAGTEETKDNDLLAWRREVAARVAEVEAKRLTAYVQAADVAYQGDLLAEAAEAIAPGWRLDPRDDRLRDLGRRISKELYRQGRVFQKAGNFENAFVAYNLALRAFPQNAWARKRAEEVRLLR